MVHCDLRRSSGARRMLPSVWQAYYSATKTVCQSWTGTKRDLEQTASPRRRVPLSRPFLRFTALTNHASSVILVADYNMGDVLTQLTSFQTGYVWEKQGPDAPLCSFLGGIQPAKITDRR